MYIQDVMDILEDRHKDFIGGLPPIPQKQSDRRYLAENGQHPMATIITCSDSRVVPEIIFNCQMGCLFVIRTAGNVLDDIGMGSVEYALNHLETPVVIVLGHTHCGAVQSACHADEHGHCTPCLQTLIDQISPSVEEARKIHTDPDKIADMAEDLNIENTMRKILFNPALKEHRHRIFGAKYDIHTSRILYLNRARFDEDENLTFSRIGW